MGRLSFSILLVLPLFSWLVYVPFCVLHIIITWPAMPYTVQGSWKTTEELITQFQLLRNS